MSFTFLTWTIYPSNIKIRNCAKIKRRRQMNGISEALPDLFSPNVLYTLLDCVFDVINFDVALLYYS